MAQHQRRGFGRQPTLAKAIEQARESRIEEMEISWMLETNHAVLNLVAGLPVRETRTFRVYERAIRD
jgi:hypothetical protein